jgi:hypothetical protein
MSSTTTIIVYTFNFLTGSKYCAVYLVAGSVLLLFHFLFFKITNHIRSAFVKPPSYLQAKSKNPISQLCRLVELPSANATENERGTYVCSRSNSCVYYGKRDARPAKREESASAVPSEPVAPLRFTQLPPPPPLPPLQKQKQYMKKHVSSV